MALNMLLVAFYSHANSVVQTVRSKCFAKCVTKPGSSLSGSESSCIARCVDRYMEATGIVTRSLFSNQQHWGAHHNALFGGFLGRHIELQKRGERFKVVLPNVYWLMLSYWILGPYMWRSSIWTFDPFSFIHVLMFLLFDDRLACESLTRWTGVPWPSGLECWSHKKNKQEVR